MDFYESYLAWYTSDAVDEKMKEELFSISRDKKEIEDRFYKELEFGTAGLRGVIGAGTNRMNRYVVRRATQGLANYINTFPDGAERGVCIAYDSRRCSKEFAAETASVLAANNIKCYLFDRLKPVPMLSFTLMRKCCIAGVVITASHNPKEYNGYKVYWENGAQVAPEQAEAIYRCIEDVEIFHAKLMDFDAAVAQGRIEMLGEAEDEPYYAAAEKLLIDPEGVRAHGGALSIVYTPLNGTGAVPVKTLLNRVGIENVFLVPEQAQPDPEFSTVSAPNPEDPKAFTLGIALAERMRASVILATDPDADRLGAAVKTGKGSWRTLTGNQIGALLLNHILSEKQKRGTLPDHGVVVKSIVSTTLADAIARAYGVAVENVLTGFRFIGEKIAEYEKTGEKTFLFGFEESFGFLAGTLCRDKDAVSSAMLVAELCVNAAREGMTLSQKLDILYEIYGYYKEKVTSYTLTGKEGLDKIAACMASLRKEPISALCGIPVVVTEDYASGVRRFADGIEETITLPKSNMLRLTLDNGAWLVVRPSGTEPKLKLYLAANAKTEAKTDALLEQLFADADGIVKGRLN